MSFLKQHIDALLLALASSTDNFAVGFSLGMAGSLLPAWANAVVAGSNATGAWVASWGGSAALQHSTPVITLVAALAFGLLALQEFRAYFTNRNHHSQQTSHTRTTVGTTRNKTNAKALDLRQVTKLAIPMTLNNLVGGVAGGAAGLSPHVTAGHALVASLATMAMGHWMGRRIWLGQSNTTVVRGMDPSLSAGCLFGLLCLLTLRDAITREVDLV